MSTSPVIVWTKLLGTSSDDYATALTTGLDGSIYVSGYTAGALDGQTNSGGNDAFLTKYSADGTKAWTKLLGTGREDSGTALTTGLDGSIYVSGSTSGPLDGQANIGGPTSFSAFLTKYSSDGTKAWTKLLGASATFYYGTVTSALTTGLDGSIYVTGETFEPLDGQTFSGSYDVFLTKYSADGTKAWTKLMGSSTQSRATALTTGLDGSIYVSGYTAGALDGQTNSGGNDAFLTKYNADGTKAWTKLLGTSGEDVANALTTGLDGSIYVSGYTAGALDGQTNSGGNDAFLTKYNADGTKAWTKLLGTSGTDASTALTTGLDGSIYVNGTTSGVLDGQTNSGGFDAFLTKYSADGTKVWTKLMGTSGSNWSKALTTGLDGSIYVSGYTDGALGGQTNNGGDDAFIVKFQEVAATSTYALSAGSSSYNEGSTATFTLTTTNVASGTSVPYTLSGVSAADIAGGALSGNAVVNSSGTATISVTLLNDSLTEGPETLGVTAGGASAYRVINDTSRQVAATSTYALSAGSSSYNEGSTATFTLTTTNVASGTSVPYTISGISAADVSGGSLSGNAVVNASGVATISVSLLNDLLTEGSENLTVSAGGATASTIVNDTSTNSKFESESNDLRSTADPATLGSAMTGQLSAITDIDYYSYTVGSAGALSITFDGPTNSSFQDFFVVQLYDSAGTKLSNWTTGADATWTAGMPSSGTYYVAVSAVSGYSFGIQSGQYALTTTLTTGGSSNFESESNDLRSTADPATLGSAMTGQLSAITDIDYYSYTVGSAGALSITFDGPTNSSFQDFFVVQLYDSAGTKLSNWTTGADATWTAGMPSSGTYYVAVSAVSGYSFGIQSGQYALTTTFKGVSQSTYSLAAASSSVNEGSTATFTLSTTNVAAGTSVPFTISGMSAADVSGGSLSGTTTVASNGQATITVLLANDNLTEGTETLTVTAGGASASAQINDTSRSASPTYSISTNWTSTTEGTPIVATLSTTNVAAGTTLYYDLSGSGITTSDFGGLSLTGSSVINSSGQASLTIPLSADTTTEGNETFVIQYYTDSGRSTAAGSAAYVTIQDTSKGAVTPTYAVSANTSSVNEGSTADFTITTTNISAGTSIAYTLSGVTSSDITGGALTGFATVNSAGTATVSVPIASDTLTEGAETLTISLQGRTASVLINDTSKAAAVPTYNLASSSSSVNEGSVASFSLTTFGVSPGTSIAYTISGVSSTDVTGGLSGTATVDINGLATISVPVAADFLTEGPETLTVTAQGKTTSVLVNDTSKATLIASYALSASTNSVSEGSNAVFTLTTTNVAGGTSIPYTISGVSSADITGGALSGTAIVSSNGNATITIPIASDLTTEDTESLTVTAQGISSSVLISDTSKTPVVEPVPPVTSTPFGDGKYFYGSSGSDKVTGTSFVDIVKQTSTFASNQLTKLSDGSWQVQNKFTPSNSDNLVNVERVEFSDMSVALDISGPTGQVAKILGAVFGPSYVNNKAFVGIGLAYLDEGMSYVDLSGLAASFAGLTTPDLLVTTLLRNITGTEPTALNKSSYLQSIANGASYASIVQQIADSSANSQSIKLPDLGNTGLAYTPHVFLPTYSLSAASSSVNEGSSAVFNLTTTKVAVGTEVSYTLSGVSASDLTAGSLTGKVTIGAGGTASINIPIAADGVTEGQESLTISAQGATASILISDTSKSIAAPTYTLTPATLSVKEGELARVYVNTTNVAAGTVLQYALSGVSSTDVTGGLSPLFVTVDSLGQAFINIQTVEDQLNEDPETIVITMDYAKTSIILVGIYNGNEPGDGGGGGGGGGGDGGGGGGGGAGGD